MPRANELLRYLIYIFLSKEWVKNAYMFSVAVVIIPYWCYSYLL